MYIVHFHFSFEKQNMHIIKPISRSKRIIFLLYNFYFKTLFYNAFRNHFWLPLKFVAATTLATFEGEEVHKRNYFVLPIKTCNLKKVAKPFITTSCWGKCSIIYSQTYLLSSIGYNQTTERVSFSFRVSYIKRH